MSLGTGLSKVAGKVFRVGHLGDTNDLTMIATLAGVEMGLKLAASRTNPRACVPPWTTSRARLRHEAIDLLFDVGRAPDVLAGRYTFWPLPAVLKRISMSPVPKPRNHSPSSRCTKMSSLCREVSTWGEV